MNHLANFRQTWHKASLGKRGFKFVKFKETALFQGGIFTKYRKHVDGNFKIFFSRTTGTISTKFGKKHSWMKKIIFCLDEEPSPFPRGDNYEKAYINEM